MEADLLEPNAMVLSTVDSNGLPDARVVLLKGLSVRGLVFYTNYNSQKAKQLVQTPACSLVFNWLPLARQIRIQGLTEELDEGTADEYFKIRPRGSKLGAWASEQSQVIVGREILDQRLRELEIKYKGLEIPRPPHWGGYLVKPYAMEFWQGRENRLHDRFRYRLDTNGQDWLVERLAP